MALLCGSECVRCGKASLFVGGHRSFPDGTHLRHRPLSPFTNPHTPHTIQSHITMNSSKKFDPNQRPSLSEGIPTLQTPTTSNSLTGEASSVEPNTTNATATQLQLTLNEDINTIREMAAWAGRVREECVALKPFLSGLTQLCKTMDEMAPRANALTPGDQRDHTIPDNTPSQHESSTSLKRPARPDPAGSPRNTKRPKRAPTHISISSGSESDSLQEITYRKTISADLRGPHRNPLRTRTPPSVSLAVRGIERPDRAVVTLHTSEPQCIGRGSPALPDMVLNLWVDEWFIESTGDGNDSHDVFSQFLRDRLPHTRHPDEPARDTVSDDELRYASLSWVLTLWLRRDRMPIAMWSCYGLFEVGPPPKHRRCCSPSARYRNPGCVTVPQLYHRVALLSSPRACSAVESPAVF
jgi:hypothetical protein